MKPMGYELIEFLKITTVEKPGTVYGIFKAIRQYY